MIICKLRIPSLVLHRPVEALAAFPYAARTIDRSPMVCYALHSAMHDSSIFVESGFLAAIDQLNVLFVSPNLGNGFFVDSPLERQAEFLADELPQLVRAMFHCTVDARQTVLCGISMGAYGAVRLALAHPERFGAVAAVSGIYLPTLPPDPRLQRKKRLLAIHTVCGGIMKQFLLAPDGSLRRDTDIAGLLASCAAERRALPHFRLWCGDADYLSVNHTEALAALLAKYGYSCDSMVVRGGHDVECWRSIMTDVANFLFATNMRQ